MSRQLVLIGLRYTTWCNDHLYFGNSWRQYESLIITMHHDHHSNSSSSDTPTVLMYVHFFSSCRIWVFECDVKHFTEVLPQVMAGGSLNSPTTGPNISFNCCCKVSA